MQCWSHGEPGFDGSAKGIIGKTAAVLGSVAMWMGFLWGVSDVAAKVLHLSLSFPALGAIALLSSVFALTLLFNLDRLCGWDQTVPDEMMDIQFQGPPPSERRLYRDEMIVGGIPAQENSATEPYAPFLS